MDEINFRRRIYSNPNDQSQDVLDACNLDPNKAAFKRDMQILDAQMAAALDVKPPKNLADRVLLSQTIEKKAPIPRRKKWYMAIAASFALMSTFVLYQTGLTLNYQTIGDYALAHVHAEEIHLNDHNSYDISDVNTKLASFGAELTSNIENVNFASYCYFAGVKSLHLVFNSEQGPVTVFIVPNSEQLDFSERFADQSYSGRAVKYQPANMVVISNTAESAQQWERKLKQDIKWQST
jgi:hypothetical protein